ncbi:S-layer homology domain-containing protein [Lysinibacillus sp. NPDC097214]
MYAKKSRYDGYVGALHSLGIINGTSPATFDPNGRSHASRQY